MTNIEEWTELKRTEVFKKYSRRLESVDFRLPDGTVSDFVIDKRGPVACILGLTTDNKVIMVRQFRPGPKKILTELPGGFIDPGEDATTAAKREFVEETGYEGDLHMVGTCLDDAYSTMVRYCFVAKNCRKVAEPVCSSTEQTVVELVSLDKFRDKLRQGQMTDVEVGYISLDYLNLL